MKRIIVLFTVLFLCAAGLIAANGTVQSIRSDFTGKNIALPTGANSITGAGTGSGLDADKVDGIQGTNLLKLDGTQTITGKKTFTTNMVTVSTNIVSVGIVDGSNASALNVGYSTMSYRAQARQLTLENGVVQSIGSITLTPGDWEITLLIQYDAAGATTGTLSETFIGTADGDNTTGAVNGMNNAFSLSVPGASGDITMNVPAWRTNITTSTTYYGKGFCSFSVGTIYMWGHIQARRIR